MIESILNATALPYWSGRCTDTEPEGTYAIYFDEVDTDGPDGFVRIFYHDAMVELYEPVIDKAAEAAVEQSISSQGLMWTKSARNWLQNVQRWQVVYEFSYIIKT